MSPVYQAALRSWAIPPAATFAIVLTALIYLRGWWLLRRAGLPFLPPWRAVTFLLGLLALWVALASPMDVLNGFVLTAHMMQHMLLMMVAPPLLLLGAPLIPIVRGLPVFAAREFAGPFLNWSVAKRTGQSLTNPVVASLLMGVTMFSWHVPAAYELALHSSSWHQVEHACFLVTSLIFWWPVVQPWPSRAQWPRWAMVPYLLIADLQNTALSAVLVFSDRILYPSYAAAPRLFGFSASEDQVAAGAIMWVVGSLAFVVPAVVIAVQCLSRKPSLAAITSARKPEPSPFDVLSIPRTIPVLGHFMRRRLSTRTLEGIWFVVLFVAAGLFFARLLAAGSDDDDQTLLFREASAGPFAVAVLANSRDLSAGPAVFSILAQDRGTQEVLLDTAVTLNAHPTADLKAPTSTALASYEDSQNKLLQTAEVNLPVVGDWMLNLVLRRNSQVAEFSLPLHVVKEDAKVEPPWSYAAFTVVAAGLLFAYVRRRRAPKAYSSPKCSAVLR